jgi:hypothetical protein
MKNHFILFVVSIASLSSAEVSLRKISFSDIKPAEVPLAINFEAIGMDPVTEDIYVVLGTDTWQSPQDAHVFRYNPHTEEKEYLGSLRGAAAAADNLGPCDKWSGVEEIPKGHAAVPYLNGKMFIGTQPWHDHGNADPNFRGSHVIAVDCATGELEDLAAAHPDGVFQKHQGFMDAVVSPGKDLLVLESHPEIDLVVFDPALNEIVDIIQGPRSGAITRDIAVTPYGKVFYSYGFGNTSVYIADLNTGDVKPAGFSTSPGFWNGRTVTRDGKVIYINDYSKLYRIDTRGDEQTEVMEEIYDFHVSCIWGINLSLDEKKIYIIPCEGDATLIELNLETMERTGLLSTGCSHVCGGDVRDSKGRIYFVEQSWSGSWDSSLLQVDVSERSGPSPYPEVTVCKPEKPSRSAVVARYVHAGPDAVWSDIRGRRIGNAVFVPKVLRLIRTKQQNTR